MFGFVHNWFATKPNPIGVDFGTDCLRMAQVQSHGTQVRLTAAASMDVPTHVRHDSRARLTFFARAARELLESGNFSGRSAILALPTATSFVTHLRLPKLDDSQMKAAVLAAVAARLPTEADRTLV